MCVVFIFKGWFLVFVMMWVRWTLPRLRIDQVMMTCLKYLVPLSCVLLLGVSLWTLLMPAPVQEWFNRVMFAGCLVIAVMAVWKLFTLTSSLPGSGHAGHVPLGGRGRLSGCDDGKCSQE